MNTYKGDTHIFNFHSDLSEVHIKPIQSDTTSKDISEIKIDGDELLKFFFTNASDKFKTVPTSINIDYSEIMDVITDALIENNRKLFEGILLIKGVNRNDFIDDSLRSLAEQMAFPIYKKLNEYYATSWIVREDGKLI